MLSRFEADYNPYPRYLMKMRRARRLFRTQPDHATIKSPSRTFEERLIITEAIHHTDKVDLRAVKDHIQETVSGELPIPSVQVAEPQKPTIIWASVDRNGFSVLRSGEKPFIFIPPDVENPE